MRKSLCFYIMVILPVLILGGNTNQYKPSQKKQVRYTKEQINNAWFKVPWSHGGHYWHNPLTGEDRDYLMDDL